MLALLPSIILLTGVTAFKWAGIRTLKASTARAAAFRVRTLRIGCGAGIYLEDIAADIPPLPGWGNYRWKITTASDSAQFYFNQGMSMYYGFHMIESIASFQKATRFDSTSAMAWYGRALSLGGTINDDATAPAPVTALVCMQKSLRYAAASTPFEKDIIQALAKRYSADTAITLTDLKQHYTDAMKAFSEKYPTGDAITLYADALMLQHPWDLYDNNQQPKPWTPLIVKTLQHALAVSPLNPGANHYYIHALEGSQHPEMALVAARTLGRLMPGVSHTTHMPSHIYIRTGDYAQGITVNDSAVADYGNYLSLYSPVVGGLDLYKIHNEHLKATCAQMAGNYATALQTANVLRNQMPAEYLTTQPVVAFVQYIWETPLLTNIRFGKWDEVLSQPVSNNLPYASQLEHFGRAIAYSRTHHFAEAQNEMALFNKGMANPALKNPAGAFSNAYTVCKVAQKILEGVLAEDNALYPQAIAAFKQAAINDDSVVYNEPRDWPLAARQYLGNVLLKTKDYKAAAAAFTDELIINPKNGWSLTGLLQAYRGLGQTALAQKTALRLKQAFALKDSDINAAVF